MAQEERIAYCPSCGGPVVYRLGRAECTRCSFTGDDAHAASAPQASRQGFQSYQPGQQGGP